MKADSTQSRDSRKAISSKPPKPYSDFPLCPANCGSWQKKIRGRVYYFGKWGSVVNGKLTRLPDDGWKKALAIYQEQRDDLQAGRTPRVHRGGLTVGDLCNRFLTAKQRQQAAAEITSRTFSEYYGTSARLVATFGRNRLIDDLAADDFEALRDAMAMRWGPVRLGNEVQKVRTVFKYGYESGLIDKPIRFGPQFKKQSASVLRRHRATNGKRMLEAEELRQLLVAADQPLKAMILLGINCGLGNHDCAMLPIAAIDLERGWLDFPRPKTGIERRCSLWQETIEALREAIDARPKPTLAAAASLVFCTVRGRPWTSREIANPISVAVRQLMKATGIHRKGLGFYTLRHVFETVAGGSRDQVAVNQIMGHADASMSATYRERIDDARLVAVAEHVRMWLWPPKNRKAK